MAATLGLSLVSKRFKEDSSNNSVSKNISSSSSKGHTQKPVALIISTEKSLRNEEMNQNESAELESSKSTSNINVFSCSQTRNMIISPERNEVQMEEEETSLSVKERKDSPPIIIPNPVSKSALLNSPEQESRICGKLRSHVGKALSAEYVTHPLLIMLCGVNLLGGLRY